MILCLGRLRGSEEITKLLYNDFIWFYMALYGFIIIIITRIVIDIIILVVIILGVWPKFSNEPFFDY